jgi:AraC-like DNA-binding protein
MSYSRPFTVEVKDIMDLMAESIEQGMSIAQLLEELDLPADCLDDPAALIDMEDCWRIIAANQNKIHEESHLMSARPLKRGTTRLVFSSLSHCPNLWRGLQVLAETYNIVHGGNYNFVRKRGNILSYVVDDSDFHYRVKSSAFGIEFALLKIHCAVSFLSGRQLKLVRMATKRERLPGHHHHLNLFDTRLLVNHDYYELAYEAEQAELPFQDTHNTDIAGNIYAHYLSLLQRRRHDIYDDSFVQQVLSRIKQGSVLEGTCNQEVIADDIGVSVATLRRRLNGQGTSFRSLLDKVNSELAVNSLHEQILPADVAENLGYSDVRSFKRAFRRWYGVSPAAYVKHHQLLQ